MSSNGLMHAGRPPRQTQPASCLDQAELAKRWRLSQRTLERWRWRKLGPAYLKLGGRVVYTLEDVEAYEVAQRQAVSMVALLAPRGVAS